jgi:hypothetical protein
VQGHESEFERMVDALRLLPHEYADSSALREWVRQKKDYKYVPSELLKEWGFAEE